MTPEAEAVVGLAVGGIVSLAVTPVAIRVAVVTDFLDRPREYRAHVIATPLLGGVAILMAFVLSALITGAATDAYAAVLPCAVTMWAIGTMDDRVALSPRWRVLAETAAAVGLYVAGLGWQLQTGSFLDLTLTIAWVVGIVNAFNLMDNLDGACATVACLSAASIGLFAAGHDAWDLTAMAFALSAAAAGFLRWNLTRPARVFLGDGGSMLVGFLVAALAMIAARSLHSSGSGVLIAGMLVGLPILDTTLVTVSRLRRGVPLTTGGRDHLTHRILLRMHTPRRVALALALAEALLGGLSLAADRIGAQAIVALAALIASTGAGAIAVLDTPGWRPTNIATSERPLIEIEPR